MIGRLKRLFYFPVAAYFRFFAGIRLRQWHPRIVVITGSNGKTTLLHMLEAQIGKQAKYSHHANSSFGVPFDILGLQRKTLLKTEWVSLFLLAPFKLFTPLPKEHIYIVEADCDRPGEGEFMAKLLQPEIVLWVSASKTHTINFQRLVDEKKFKNVEEAIAYEFGYFLEYCLKYAVINGDNSFVTQQKSRTKAEVVEVNMKALQKYEVKNESTEFVISNKNYTINYLLPEEIFYSIEMCRLAVSRLQLSFDEAFKEFILPPGRGSIFKGIKDTTLIDSSYNANLASMIAILEMYKKLPNKKKWLVVGDMLEQGRGEQAEHEKLADFLRDYTVEKLILLGPRVCKYTYPKLQNQRGEGVPMQAFENPHEVLEFLEKNLTGRETILFKGARFMEGIIEHLLVNKRDIEKLPRREKIWEIRREQWDL